MEVEDLKRRVRRGESLEYLLFWGHKSAPDAPPSASCLSQWHPSPFVVDAVRYPTAEHWMMAEKARLFRDAEMLARILQADSPGAAKKLGGMVRGFDERLWRARRFEVVVAGNVHKFGQNPHLRAFLHSTGSKVLVEASPVDRIWGIGLAKDATEAEDPLRWRGLNLLGFALMEVRERLCK